MRNDIDDLHIHLNVSMLQHFDAYSVQDGLDLRLLLEDNLVLFLELLHHLLDALRSAEVALEGVLPHCILFVRHYIGDSHQAHDEADKGAPPEVVL